MPVGESQSEPSTPTTRSPTPTSVSTVPDTPSPPSSGAQQIRTHQGLSTTSSSQGSMSSGVAGGIASSAPHQSSGVAATSVQGSAAPGAAQGQNAGGVVDFPLPGQKGAPKKFKGKHSEVLTFLHFYERLCSKHHVVDDDDKVESITQYCSRSVRKFMEALPSFVKKDECRHQEVLRGR